MMKMILSSALVLAGLSLVIAYVMKKIKNFNSLDDAYKEIYKNIKEFLTDSSASGEIIDPNYMLTYDELKELETVLDRHFYNISIVDTQVINGLFIVSYNIVEIKQIYSGQEDVLKSVIVIDIQKYYRDKRNINIGGVYIKTLTKNELTFEVGCSVQGSQTIIDLINADNVNKQYNAPKELIESFGVEENDNRI